MAELGLSQVHYDGKKRENNRAESSHLPIRKRELQQQGFKFQGFAQSLLTNPAAIHNTFYTACYLTTRPTLSNFRAAAFETY